MSLRTIHKGREVRSYKELIILSEKILSIRLNIPQKIILWFTYTINKCKKWG